MGSRSQDGVVRRSRRCVLVVSILLVGGLAAGKARGDIYVHVMNCAYDNTVKVDAYDANDSVKVTPASSKDVSTGNNEQLHCAGEGEGYCQMQFKFSGQPGDCYNEDPISLGKHVDSGKWAVIKGMNLNGGYNDTNSYCVPDIEVLDSQPSSCQAVCGNCN